MEETATVTATQALQALQDVVAEVGEGHTIERCIYVQDGTPHCLVARALDKLGYTEQVLMLEDGDHVGALNYTRVGKLADAGHITGLSMEAEHVLGTAQAQQDSREHWGKALAVATKEARRLGYID